MQQGNLFDGLYEDQEEDHYDRRKPFSILELVHEGRFLASKSWQFIEGETKEL